MRTPTGKTGRAVLAVAAAALSMAPLAIGTAGAQPASPTDQAREHFTRGKQLFGSGEYRGAIAEFAAADKLAPSPLLEFNIALCHERLGERAEAVRRYHLFLERVPDATNRSAVEAKIARLEAEMKAEAESRQAAPPPAGLPPAGGVAPIPPLAGGGAPPPPAGEGATPPGPAAPPPASTGDPDLDRVARIDIGRLRSERMGAGQGPGASPPPPPANRAAGSTPSGPAGSPPAAPAPPQDEGGEKKEKPIYKQWWFWVVAGVSAIIIYNIVSADSDSSDGRARLLPLDDAPRAAQPGGAVLFRF